MPPEPPASSLRQPCEYPIDACDVVDKTDLPTFRALRARWLDWLTGDDRHAIWPQINMLLWDAVLFRTVNDLRRDALEGRDSDAGFNGPILRMLDAGFVATQVTTIRRLTDHQPRDPRKGVISLRRLIADIRANREVMTREVYVSYDGLPYDWEEVQARWMERMPLSELTRFQSLPTKGPHAWATSQMMHQNFDRLSRSDPRNRKRVDLVSEHWFDWLDQQLDACHNVRKYTDKFVAHAAEPESRADLVPAQIGITLDRLESAAKAVLAVAKFVYGPLLYEGGYGAVPIPQYDHLANLELPWVSKARKQEAYQYWKIHFEQVESWENEPSWPPEARDT